MRLGAVKAVVCLQFSEATAVVLLLHKCGLAAAICILDAARVRSHSSVQ